MNPLILQAALLGFLLSIYIGPVFFYLLETAINQGRRAAFAVEIGILLSDSLWIVLVYMASDFLTDVTQNNWLYMIGGAIFLVIGIGAILTRKKASHAVKIRKRNQFANAILLNFTNPSVPIFWLGISTVIVESDSEFSPVLFYSILLLTAAFIDSFKILLVHKLKPLLKPSFQVKLKMGIGIFFVGFGVLLWWRFIDAMMTA